MDADLVEALGGPDSPMITTPIEEFLEALGADRALPEVAVAACMLRIAEAAPALRAVLARAADGEALSDPDSTLLFRGLHILGAARDTAAWPLLVCFLRRPPEEVRGLLGDAITQNLGSIVAGLFDGEAASLFDLALDTSVEEFVRDALIGAATFLTIDGRIERPAMEAFLRRFFEEPPEQYDFAWSAWLESIALIGVDDLVPSVEDAFRRDRIGDGIYSLKDFRRERARGPASRGDADRLGTNQGYIEDVVVALRPFGDVGEDDDGSEELLWPGPGSDEGRARPNRYVLQQPVRNPYRDVGRNDPCPCGSGKKAKKCCLKTG